MVVSPRSFEPPQRVNGVRLERDVGHAELVRGDAELVALGVEEGRPSGLVLVVL